MLAPKRARPEKLSAYECGFNAFDDARMKFDVRFYLVSILFIIFDLEVAFLFPWAVSLMKLPHGRGQVFAFWSMMGFLGVLTVGFIYEWKKAPSNGSDRSPPRLGPCSPLVRCRRALVRRGLRPRSCTTRSSTACRASWPTRAS